MMVVMHYEIQNGLIQWGAVMRYCTISITSLVTGHKPFQQLLSFRHQP